jgi:hypothetical protein
MYSSASDQPEIETTLRIWRQVEPIWLTRGKSFCPADTKKSRRADRTKYIGQRFDALSDDLENWAELENWVALFVTTTRRQPKLEGAATTRQTDKRPKLSDTHPNSGVGLGTAVCAG